jgi:ATP-binding cassette subfamily B protein
MDRGRIVEIGNHDQLMAAEGHYYKLYMAQARNVDTEEQLPLAPDLPKTVTV